jgi:hypothetical protein
MEKLAAPLAFWFSQLLLVDRGFFAPVLFLLLHSLEHVLILLAHEGGIFISLPHSMHFLIIGIKDFLQFPEIPQMNRR